jgi:hypothetical protein
MQSEYTAAFAAPCDARGEWKGIAFLHAYSPFYCGLAHCCSELAHFASKIVRTPYSPQDLLDMSSRGSPLC